MSARDSLRTMSVVGLCILVVGGLQTLPLSGEMHVDPEDSEVRFGALLAGSSVGLNATNASASINGGALLATTSVLYLNNTNATGAWYAKIVLTSSSGIANLLNGRVGIDNGTSSDQVIVLLGSLTQAQGSYVRLAPASTNTIYVTTLLSNPILVSALGMDIYLTSDPSETDLVVLKGAFSVV